MAEDQVGITPGDSAEKPAKPASRARNVAIGAVTVFVLAAVIFGVSALSGTDDPPPAPDTAQLTAAQQSQQAYEAALVALESKDTTKAVVLLKKAVTLDPSNQAAQDELDRVTKPTTPQGSDDDDEAPPVADDSAFLKEVSDISKLLPAAVAGYSLGTTVGEKPDVTRSGTPTGRPGEITLAVWAVHDRGDAKKAQAYITDTSKKAYSKDGADVTIDGAKGYFGTDGTRFATVTYARGRYVFEVILTSNSGAPKGERAKAEEAAKAFPDKP